MNGGIGMREGSTMQRQDNLESDAPTPLSAGVSAAVVARRAVRAFRPDPVDLETVRDILGIAGRAPSGGNLQPWIVHVVAGKRLDELKALIAGKLDQETPDESEYQVYPSGLWEPHRTWRREAGSGRYDALGFPEKSIEGRMELLRRNYRFFDAPVGLFFCIDRRMGPPQWADLGMFMQTVMLLAVERGLDTCPQEVWSNVGRTVGAFLGLPDNVMLFAGMALGFRDPAERLCAVETTRADVDHYVTLHV